MLLLRERLNTPPNALTVLLVSLIDHESYELWRLVSQGCIGRNVQLHVELPDSASPTMEARSCRQLPGY